MSYNRDEKYNLDDVKELLDEYLNSNELFHVELDYRNKKPIITIFEGGEHIKEILYISKEQLKQLRKTGKCKYIPKVGEQESTLIKIRRDKRTW